MNNPKDMLVSKSDPFLSDRPLSDTIIDFSMTCPDHGSSAWFHERALDAERLESELSRLRQERDELVGVVKYAAGMPDDEHMPGWAMELRNHARTLLAKHKPE